MKMFLKKRKSQNIQPAEINDATTAPKGRGESKAKKKRQKSKKQRVGFLGNIRIAPKLLAGFLLVALLSASLGVYAALSLRGVSDASKSLYASVLLPTKNISNMITLFDKQSIYLRQAIINDDAILLQAYISEIKSADLSVTSQFNAIKGLLPKEYHGDVDALAAKYEVFKTSMADALGKLEAGNKAYIVSQLKNGDLYRAEIDTKKGFDDLMYITTGKAAEVSTKNNNTANQVFLIVLIAAGAVLVLSVLGGVFIARGISKPIKKLTANVKKLAAGETDIEVSEAVSKDEVGQIREAFRKILQVIKDLTQDTDMLIGAVAQGQLSVRADADKHQGAFRKIVEGINATLDSTITPMVESANVLGELSNGNLNTGVTGEFEGDFAIVKNAVNNTIETLKSYIEEITATLGMIAR